MSQIDRVVEAVEETLRGNTVHMLAKKKLPRLDLPKASSPAVWTPQEAPSDANLSLAYSRATSCVCARPLHGKVQMLGTCRVLKVRVGSAGAAECAHRDPAPVHGLPGRVHVLQDQARARAAGLLRPPGACRARRAGRVRPPGALTPQHASQMTNSLEPNRPSPHALGQAGTLTHALVPRAVASRDCCQVWQAHGHEQAPPVLILQVREIWLSSEDTGAYGRDLGYSLPQLLRSIIAVLPEDGRTMLRIGEPSPGSARHSDSSEKRCLPPCSCLPSWIRFGGVMAMVVFRQA